VNTITNQNNFIPIPQEFCIFSAIPLGEKMGLSVTNGLL
jgi:hypothetical protein